MAQGEYRAFQLAEGRSLRYDVTLDALLMGHESGLTNVRWAPSGELTLLSTAADNSLVIWTPSSDGIWVPRHRFGAIGGRGLSFYGAIWGPESKSVLASGWNGGWERWIETAPDQWEVRPGLTGHYGDVKSVAWDPKGDYLASVRYDAATSFAGDADFQYGSDDADTRLLCFE